MTTIPYHIERDDQMYSLSFAHASRAECENYLRETDERTEGHVRPLDGLPSETYAAYTAVVDDSVATAAADAPVHEPEVQLVLRTHEAIVENASPEGSKQYDLQKVAQVFSRVQWKQSVGDVAAELLSRLILAHPLPNTNHRTSVAVACSYIATHEPRFEPPNELAGEPLPEWAVEYFADSKRLVTVRRNARLFGWLAERGITVLQRKNGIDIELAEYDLDVGQPMVWFADQHVDRTTEFIRILLEKSGCAHVAEEQDAGRRTFRARIRRG